MATIEWHNSVIGTIGQTALPHKTVHLQMKHNTEIAEAIRSIKNSGVHFLRAAANVMALIAFARVRPWEITNIGPLRITVDEINVMNPVFNITSFKRVTTIIRKQGILRKENFQKCQSTQ